MNERYGLLTCPYQYIPLSFSFSAVHFQLDLALLHRRVLWHHRHHFWNCTNRLVLWFLLLVLHKSSERQEVAAACLRQHTKLHFTVKMKSSSSLFLQRVMYYANTFTYNLMNLKNLPILMKLVLIHGQSLHRKMRITTI